VIFIDSSYLIALVNERDPYHDEAVELLAFGVGNELWVSTHLVFGRLWDFLAPRVGAMAARWLLGVISSSHQLKILPVTQAMQAEAFGILGTGVKDPLSYVDATSITLMRALG